MPQAATPYGCQGPCIPETAPPAGCHRCKRELRAALMQQTNYRGGVKERELSRHDQQHPRLMPLANASWTTMSVLGSCSRRLQKSHMQGLSYVVVSFGYPLLRHLLVVGHAERMASRCHTGAHKFVRQHTAETLTAHVLNQFNVTLDCLQGDYIGLIGDPY